MFAIVLHKISLYVEQELLCLLENIPKSPPSLEKTFFSIQALHNLVVTNITLG
jgi:hypothetical protein